MSARSRHEPWWRTERLAEPSPAERERNLDQEFGRFFAPVVEPREAHFLLDSRFFRDDPTNTFGTDMIYLRNPPSPSSAVLTNLKDPLCQ